MSFNFELNGGVLNVALSPDATEEERKRVGYIVDIFTPRPGSNPAKEDADHSIVRELAPDVNPEVVERVLGNLALEQ